ncbi:uncharacterized protein [Triticum aestivum]|uniref:uncharacterized protein n=1 Tax=Triticum aestivum TaxID=4565 RepID=UPI001ABC7532|nr:uncharacterized protein LOC109778667 [Aegilops tauschii subsp. strangulata]XP_044353415.1 uncharacterized protein LOC123074712 [Triticum aestivum]
MACIHGCHGHGWPPRRSPRPINMPNCNPSSPSSVSPLIPHRPLLICLNSRSEPRAAIVLVITVIAATVVSGVREHVQEVRRGRIRLFQGPAQAGTSRTFAIDVVLSVYFVAVRHRLPLLRAVPYLPDLAVALVMVAPRS